MKTSKTHTQILRAKHAALRDAARYIVRGWLAGEDINGPRVAHGIAELLTLLQMREGPIKRY